MTDLWQETMTGEQWVLETRTSDPTTTLEGERWIREDLNSGDKIATLRVDVGSGVRDVPIFSTGTAVDTVSEAMRVRVNGVTGYIPIAPVSDAAYPELRMQHNSQVHGYHDSVEPGSAIPDTLVTRNADDGATGSSANHGLKFETSQEWPDFQAEISSDTNIAPDEELVIADTGDNPIQTVDVSGKTSGDIVTVRGSNLAANTQYYIYLKSSNSRTRGYNNSQGFPATSSDGNLSITAGYFQGSDNNAYYGLRSIGNINL